VRFLSHSETIYAFNTLFPPYNVSHQLVYSFTTPPRFRADSETAHIFRKCRRILVIYRIELFFTLMRTFFGFIVFFFVKSHVFAWWQLPRYGTFKFNHKNYLDYSWAGIYFFWVAEMNYCFHTCSSIPKVQKKFFQRIHSCNDVLLSFLCQCPLILEHLTHFFKRGSGIRSSHFISRLFTMNGHSCLLSQLCASVSERKAAFISAVPLNSRLLVNLLAL